MGNKITPDLSRSRLTSRHDRRSHLSCRAFTLIELLVVLAIIAILASLTAPSIMNVLRSSSLTTGGNGLVDQFNFSRQYAMARNCRVEVRLYQLPDSSTPSSTSPTVYRAFQSFAMNNNGTVSAAITKVVYLPSQVYMVPNGTVTVSSLLPTTASNPPFYVTGTTAGSPLGIYPPASYNYFDFHFQPDGSTDLAASQSWFVSLANQRAALVGTTGLPANFVTVQVDSLTGRTRSFRPN